MAPIRWERKYWAGDHKGRPYGRELTVVGLGNGGALVYPGAGVFEGGGGGDDGRLVVHAPDDVKADGESIFGEAGGYAGGGMTDDVYGVCVGVEAEIFVGV